MLLTRSNRASVNFTFPVQAHHGAHFCGPIDCVAVNNVFVAKVPRFSASVQARNKP